MGLKRALRNVKDKSSTVYIISLLSPCHRPHNRPRHSTVHAISMSSQFHCPSHSCILAGSFPVRCGDYLRFWDHLPSNLEIICGRGSFTVSESFAAMYRAQVATSRNVGCFLRLLEVLLQKLLQVAAEAVRDWGFGRVVFRPGPGTSSINKRFPVIWTNSLKS